MASLYNAGAERGFGVDFTHGSLPLLEDWVQVVVLKPSMIND